VKDRSHLLGGNRASTAVVRCVDVLGLPGGRCFGGLRDGVLRGCKGRDACKRERERDQGAAWRRHRGCAHCRRCVRPTRDKMVQDGVGRDRCRTGEYSNADVAKYGVLCTGTLLCTSQILRFGFHIVPIYTLLCPTSTSLFQIAFQGWLTTIFRWVYVKGWNRRHTCLVPTSMSHTSSPHARQRIFHRFVQTSQMIAPATANLIVHGGQAAACALLPRDATLGGTNSFLIYPYSASQFAPQQSLGLPLDGCGAFTGASQLVPLDRATSNVSQQYTSEMSR
jgi:hypothetical protein